MAAARHKYPEYLSNRLKRYALRILKVAASLDGSPEAQTIFRRAARPQWHVCRARSSAGKLHTGPSRSSSAK